MSFSAQLERPGTTCGHEGVPKVLCIIEQKDYFSTAAQP